MYESIIGVVLSLIGAHFLFAGPVGTIYAFAQRKLGADLQARVGPNRVGPGGVLQSFADQVKLLQKRANERSTRFEKLWEFFQIAALQSALMSVPIAADFLLVQNELSVFLPFVSLLVVIVGDLFIHLGTQDLSRWMSGLRRASQLIAGLLPALVSIITVGMVGGSFEWRRLIDIQSGSLLNWMLFSDPFVFVSFFIFIASGMVILAVSPFDSPTQGADIQTGLRSNNSQRQAILHSFIRFYSLLIWSLTAGGLYMGGWSIPFALDQKLLQAVFFEGAPGWATLIFQLIWVLLKTVTLLLGISIIGRVMPRVRFDQVAQFAWRVLGPISLVCLVCSAALRASGGTL